MEDGKGVLQLVGLTQHPCLDLLDFVRLSNVGRGARATVATEANATSSRSHAAMLFRLVRLPDNTPLAGETEGGEAARGRYGGGGGQGGQSDWSELPCVGKFSLIDLAGAERSHERGERTEKKGKSSTTQMESKAINQSLLALKEVGPRWSPHCSPRNTHTHDTGAQLETRRSQHLFIIVFVIKSKKICTRWMGLACE